MEKTAKICTILRNDSFNFVVWRQRATIHLFSVLVHEKVVSKNVVVSITFNPIIGFYLHFLFH